MAGKPAQPTVEDVTALLRDADPEQVKKVLALGKKAWPYSFKADTDLPELRSAIEAAYQPGQKGNDAKKRHKVAGRLRAKRGSGGIAFLDIEGRDAKIQAILDKAEMGEKAFDEALHLLNEGDFVGVTGYPMRSKRGEPSIGAEKVALLAKAVVPFADLGKSDSPELRFGRPYLNFMQGPKERKVLVDRARIIATLRTTLEKEGFIEAMIPVLEKVYGGANAKPFTTHSNAKDTDMFLRISHELALKKLLVGGLEKVYHIGPAFRNEDIDTTHNPEFTLLECYAAYWDYHDMMRLTEKLVRRCVAAVRSNPSVNTASALAASPTSGPAAPSSPTAPAATSPPAQPMIDFERPFAVITMKDAIRAHGGPDPDTATDEEIQAILERNHIVIRGGYTRGLGIAKLFEHFAEARLIQPTFVIDHPRETTPLCKAHRKDPSLVERFELFVNGREHANSYSELNDPYQQAKAFAEQEARRTAGDDEAPPTDQDFIQALKHGMPPAGGLGIGVDRLVMTILGIDSIKAVLPFPQVK